MTRMRTSGGSGLGWVSIVRLGLVQASLGAIVALTTSTLNRVMIVELGVPACLPAALVAWHYALQLSRPYWGYGSDLGRRRTPWIVGGMGVLALGALLATNAALMIPASPVAGTLLSIVAFTLIGGGVGAAGTSLLAMLAAEVAPERRPAAASITWIMMIAGIVLSAALSGANLDPFSPQRLAVVASCVCGSAFLLTLLATWNLEQAPDSRAELPREEPGFREAFARIWAEPAARQVTIFIFVSMLAYSMQDLILEPYAGLVFGFTLGESTKLASVQHTGVLIGMIVAGFGGALYRGSRISWMRAGTVAGCIASAAALVLLAVGGSYGAGWPLRETVFALGAANGLFAVSAIGMMMAHAGEGEARREGARMGLWGASQAIAFAAGGFVGASGLDILRRVSGVDAPSFAAMFLVEAALFAVAAVMAAGLARPRTSTLPHARPLIAGE